VNETIERPSHLLLTREQAGLLLELVNRAAWSGMTVELIAPMRAQLRALAPPPASTDARAGQGA
jgi:hypothetical protein